MTTNYMTKPLLIGAAATALLSCLAGYVWHEEQRPETLEIYVFSLRSGRSMFIRTPDDRRILVDGGANSEIIRHLTKVLPFYTRRIDAIIATNTDGKNVSGLIDVVARYDIGRAYVPRFTLDNLHLASSTDHIYETFLEVLEMEEIQVDEIKAGDQIPLSGLTQGEERFRATLYPLFPVSPDTFTYSKASGPELLFSIVYGNTSVTFMGDASVKVQKYVASSSEIVREQVVHSGGGRVLVVSHSAAEGNISTELMNGLRPDFLVYEKALRAEETKKALAKPPAKNSTKNSTKNASKNKKPKPNPLAAILNDDRFNLKEVGTVKITSDGEGIIIENPD